MLYAVTRANICTLSVVVPRPSRARAWLDLSSVVGVHQVQHLRNKSFAAAKVIPVKYEEELEDFVVEVSCAHRRLCRDLRMPRSCWPACCGCVGTMATRSPPAAIHGPPTPSSTITCGTCGCLADTGGYLDRVQAPRHHWSCCSTFVEGSVMGKGFGQEASHPPPPSSSPSSSARIHSRAVAGLAPLFSAPVLPLPHAYIHARVLRWQYCSVPLPPPLSLSFFLVVCPRRSAPLHDLLPQRRAA